MPGKKYALHFPKDETEVDLSEFIGKILSL